MNSGHAGNAEEFALLLGREGVAWTCWDMAAYDQFWRGWWASHSKQDSRTRCSSNIAACAIPNPAHVILQIFRHMRLSEESKSGGRTCDENVGQRSPSAYKQRQLHKGMPSRRG